jgi:hypothetical protein
VKTTTSSESHEHANHFDVEKAVWTFRHVITKLDAATTPEAKAEFEAIAKRMRKTWQDEFDGTTGFWARLCRAAGVGRGATATVMPEPI